MIIAKLNPGISIIQQESPFTAPKTETYNWITAIVQRYVAGANKANVNLLYGTVEMNEFGTLPVSFRRVSSATVELTAEELSTWGTDDVALLQILATKLSLTIEDTYEIEDSF